jgi:ABC-type uncharacterized transport system involved in gliding motility auxiliary subunit
VTNTRPDLRTMRPTRLVSGLDPLLGHYGIRVGRDIVVDRAQNGAMRFPVRVGQKSGYRDINYPLIPKATELAKGSVLVAGLNELLFPFASTVTPTEELSPGLTLTALATSSPSSGSVSTVRSLDPGQLKDVLPEEKRGPFPLLVAATGGLRSFFETRPIPPAVEGIPAPYESEPEEPPGHLVEGAPTRLVVAGSADFIANNTAFMLNLCDWLVQDEALIGIRSKIATLPPLRATTPERQLLWKLALLLAGPALLLAYGGIRRLRRAPRARRAG